MTRFVAAGLVVAVGLAGACTPRTPPAMPAAVAWREPALPRDGVPPDLARTYRDAWTAIRAGDRDGGARRLRDLGRRVPLFAPAWASLGELALARQDYAAAAAEFARALAAEADYLPAHQGAVDAALGRRDDRAAVQAIDRLLTVQAGGPVADEARGRRAVVVLRVAEQADAQARARERAGDLAGARGVVAEALVLAPDTAALLVRHARLSLAAGAVSEAEQSARRATVVDDADAGAYDVLADVLDRAGRAVDAAAAAARAYVLDPTPARRDRRDALATRAGTSLPAPLRGLATAATVSRAELAAWMAQRLGGVLAQVPRRPTVVVTDLVRHWAAPAAQAVLDAGWMAARPNHTFDPAAVVTRADLARAVAAALPDVASRQPALVARWRAARPTVPGVPATHAAYAAIAMAVSAGIMTPEGDAFLPARAVSGAEVIAAIDRLERAAR